MRQFVTTNSFNAVAAGGTATVSLPVRNRIYHSLVLYYGTGTAGGPTEANMIAEIEEVRIKVDGKVQRRFTAEELFAINAFNGVAVEDGILPIFFSEPWRRTAQGEDALAWGTGDINTFQVEVDIASGATAPTLSARVEIEAGIRAMGTIVKWRKFVVPVSATGVVNLTTLPMLDAYYRMHAFSGNIADVEIRVDQAEVFKATQTQNDHLLSKVYGKTPQASTYHVSFDRTDRVSDALPMVRADGGRVSEFRLDFNMSAAASFPLLTETLGARD